MGLTMNGVETEWMSRDDFFNSSRSSSCHRQHQTLDPHLAYEDMRNQPQQLVCAVTLSHIMNTYEDMRNQPQQLVCAVTLSHIMNTLTT